MAERRGPENVESNGYSEYQGEDASLYVYCNGWSGSGQDRSGFIEPQGYITRVPVRDGILGAVWAASSNPAANDKGDIPLKTPTAPHSQGRLEIMAGEYLRTADATEDRICCPVKGSLKDSNQIQQLVTLTDQPASSGCFAYVCMKNRFITHAPYMATNHCRRIVYDVMIGGQEGLQDWMFSDVAKWINRGEKPQPFGRYQKAPIKISVPAELSLSWNDAFANSVTKWVKDICTFGTEDATDGRVYRRNKSLFLTVGSADHEDLQLKPDSSRTAIPWPVFIAGDNIILSGSPVDLAASSLPEIHKLQTALDKYPHACPQAALTKVWSVWCLERVIEMYTASRTGKVNPGSHFDVYPVDYSKVYVPQASGRWLDVSKGCGIPMLVGNSKYDSICTSLLLNGVSRSPMVLTYFLLFGRIGFGRSMGTPFGTPINLFLHDYGGDRVMPGIREWMIGMGNRVAQIHSGAEDPGKVLLEVSVYTCEFIRAKKEYEDAMRRAGVKLSYACAWKDLKELLHFRLLDGFFVNGFFASSLDDDAYDVAGIAAILHDIIDYGYDLSVCDCGNMLFTLAAKDGTSYEGIELAYAICLAAWKYTRRVHKYTTPGLSWVATHYWQLANGRHRILNCAMNVAAHKLPRVLQPKHTMIATIAERSSKELGEQPVINHALCKEKYNQLKATAEELGSEYPTFLKSVVARPYEAIYGEPLDEGAATLTEIDTITSTIACTCVDASNEGIDLLWDVALFMWDETAIMWHAFLGSLLVAKDRMAGDDTAGYGYPNRPWDI